MLENVHVGDEVMLVVQGLGKPVVVVEETPKYLMIAGGRVFIRESGRAGDGSTAYVTTLPKRPAWKKVIDTLGEIVFGGKE